MKHEAQKRSQDYDMAMLLLLSLRVLQRIVGHRYFLLLDIPYQMSVTFVVLWYHCWFNGLEWFLRPWFMRDLGSNFASATPLCELQFPELWNWSDINLRVAVKIKWGNAQCLLPGTYLKMETTIVINRNTNAKRKCVSELWIGYIYFWMGTI